MPTSATYIITGNPTGNVNSSLAANGFDKSSRVVSSDIFGRVLSVNNDRSIAFEYLNNNFNSSTVGTSTSGQTAYPSSNTIIKLPVVGEIVKLFNGPEPFNLSTNKAQYTKVIYYEPQPLNAWQDVNNNVILDNTIPQNTPQGNNVNVDVNSYINSSNGF